MEPCNAFDARSVHYFFPQLDSTEYDSTVLLLWSSPLSSSALPLFCSRLVWILVRASLFASAPTSSRPLFTVSGRLVRIYTVMQAVSPRPLSSAALLVLLSGPRFVPAFLLGPFSFPSSLVSLLCVSALPLACRPLSSLLLCLLL